MVRQELQVHRELGKELQLGREAHQIAHFHGLLVFAALARHLVEHVRQDRFLGGHLPLRFGRDVHVEKEDGLARRGHGVGVLDAEHHLARRPRQAADVVADLFAAEHPHGVVRALDAVAQDEDGEYVDVVGWRITDVVQLIRGPKETVVRLQILPADAGLNATPVELELVRDKVKLEDQAAKSEILEVTNDGFPYRIGIITIPKFYTDLEAYRDSDKESKSTVTDVKRILENLKNEQVDGIVIDLRNNGGGLLSAGVEIAKLFLRDGIIIQQQYRGENIESFSVSRPGELIDLSLVILINHSTASAAEIIAGSLQAHKRAPLIGEPTFGKDTIQLVFDLQDDSSLHVTAAKWWIPGLEPPLGENGLQPDLQVDSGDSDEDKIMNVAIQSLLGK